MTQQHIELGMQTDGKDGDTNRAAWQKAESNFNELYSGALSTPSFKNLLVNGDFDIWQRGNSGFPTTGYAYTADRWKILSPGSAIIVSRQQFAPGQSDIPNNPRYFIRNAVTSVAGANNCCILAQFIEDIFRLSGQTVTVSFWAKADAARRIGVSLDQNPGSGGSPGAQVQGAGQAVQLSTAWQRFVLNFTLPSIAGLSIGTSGNDSTSLNFWLDAGGNYNARSGSIGQQSGVFDIAQVQVEVGQYATSFDNRPAGFELDLCQRYTRIVNGGGLTGVTLSPTTILFAGQWPTMRANPTVTLLKTSFSAATYELLAGAAWVGGSNCALSQPGVTSQSIVSAVNGFSGLTSGQPVLINNVGANILLLDAEL
ncbi:carbohydrate binding domain-containing protein [Dyella sp. SG609]|uniref:carbohydrate binding domain-containing protein n=1 Tax=Dyella sp. SG609 TaxID=2587018 RepID=UPI001447E90D|nr:carbohydrate binding domain-containing protein [Dyella sp. SG609]NKJ22658.1 hypothetical protein [Dyella sp. SG609]